MTTDAGVLLARLLLAVVLATAAVAKLLDREGGRAALTDFGVPSALAQPFARMLPVTELATAAALLWPRTAVIGGIAALALLLMFTIAIAANLAQGNSPDCHCFGQMSSGAVDWSSVARNAALGGCAVFVALAGPGTTWSRAIDWVGGLSAPVVAAAIGSLAVGAALVLQWTLMLNLIRQNGRLLRRIEALEEHGLGTRSAGLPVGSNAPEFNLAGADGHKSTLASLLGENQAKPLVLVFTDPRCGPCKTLLPELADWESKNRDSIALALISRRSNHNGQLPDVEKPFRQVLMQEEFEVMNAYGAPGTPAAVVINNDATIASHVALGAVAIHELLQSTVTRRAAVVTD